MYDPVDPMTGGYDQGVLMDIQRTQMQLSQTLAQFQLNFEKEVERFDHALRGVAKDAKTGGLVQIHAPIVNKRGYTHIMKKVRSILNKIIAQSNYDENMIRAWCRVYWLELTADAMSYGDYWDLQQDEYSSLVHDFVYTIYGIMECAKNGGLREIIGKISKVMETINNQIPERKRGFLV